MVLLYTACMRSALFSQSCCGRGDGRWLGLANGGLVSINAIRYYCFILFCVPLWAASSSTGSSLYLGSLSPLLVMACPDWRLGDIPSCRRCCFSNRSLYFFVPNLREDVLGGGSKQHLAWDRRRIPVLRPSVPVLHPVLTLVTDKFDRFSYARMQPATFSFACPPCQDVVVSRCFRPLTWRV